MHSHLFSSCERDLYEDNLNTSSKKLIIKSINLNTYNKKPQDLVSFHRKMQKRMLNKQNNKMVFDSINNFYVDEENTKYISDGNKESYTVSIKKENVSEIENLVFNKRADGQFDTFLVKYEYTPEELKLFTFSQISQKRTKFYPVEFDDNGLMTYKGTTGWTCYDVYSIESEYGYMDVLVWQGWTLMFSICDYDYDDEIGGNSGGGGSNYGNTGPQHYGAGTANTYTNTNTTGGVYGNGGLDGTGIHTIPIAPKKTPREIKTAFVAFLATHPNQLAWWNNQANPLIVGEIVDYLTINQTYGIEDQTPSDFVLECINQIMQNPTVFTSFKPFVIEKQIDDSLLNPCAQGVLASVKNSTVCDIANVLAKLDANGSIYNTKIKTEYNYDNSGNQINSPANTKRNSLNNYTIYLNPDYSDKTKLFIANLLIHELVHAYFLSIVDDYNSNPNNNQNLYNLNSFPSLFQAYCDKKYPPVLGMAQNIHHLEMANYYVDAIARSLQEYQTGIPVSTGSSPQQIYTDLAWGGLNGTPVFDATYPIGDANRQRILNRFLCEQNGTPIAAGTPNEQTPIGNPCN